MIKKHVLIVEDDISSQLVLKNMLARIDPEAHVDCVQSAEGAYRVINDAGVGRPGYDLVLADLQLPGSSGLVLWDLCSKKHPMLSFVFVSGVSSQEWFSQLKRYSEWPPLMKKPVGEHDLRQLWNLQFGLCGEGTG